MKNKFFFIIFFFLLVVPIYAQKTLQITDFGATPGSWNDVVPAIKKCLDACRGLESVTINFPKGRYDFWLSHCEGELSLANGFYLKDLKNITIEGNGSELIFHGIMQIACFESCENIVFQNFTVDWDRPPYASQVEIVQAADNYLDVWIDKTQYPYLIENGKIMFTGEGWKLPVERYLLFDKDRKEIVPKTWGNALGNIFKQTAEELGNGIVRFAGKPAMKPAPGTYVALHHPVPVVGEYRFLPHHEQPPCGFRIIQSKNTLLKNLMIFHATYNGINGERSEDITMDNVNVTVNESKGRVFSAYADAMHFMNCKGVIKVENCTHTGQGDDFINVYGINLVIRDIVDTKTIEVDRYGRLFMPGDEVWFLEQIAIQRGEIRVVESCKPVYKNNQHVGFQISFTTELPQTTKVKDFIENKTWTASLELRNCNILKKHAARGILVTTPKDVVIENNYFRTAGTAILIEGDSNFWLSSGATANVKIRNNVFEDCLTSGNTNGSAWEWGDAVISILPWFQPLDENAEPYHKNITIQDNVFKVFDAPLVRARSVRNLQFIGNEIIKTETYKPYTWQKSAFLLDGCRDVLIRGNRFDERYTTRDILIEHMRKSDVKSDKPQNFKINFVKDIKTYHHHIKNNR